MIFGLSYKSKETQQQDDVILKIAGIQEFAWFPKKLDDGRWIWWQDYWKFYSGFYDHVNDMYHFWYHKNKPAYQLHANSLSKNIWCTKQISEEDMRHDVMNDSLKASIAMKAFKIRKTRSTL